MDLLSVMAGPWHRQRSSHRLVLSLAFANVVWWNIALAQPRMTGSFGPCLEREVPYSPVDLASGPRLRSSTPSIALLTDMPMTVSLYKYTMDSGMEQSVQIPLVVHAHTVLNADLNRDGVAELLVPAEDAPTIQVLRNMRGKWLSDTISCPVIPERILVADINSDGRNDILLFGRSMAGVATLYGQKNGTFIPGPVLFDDISVSDLRVLDVNGDGIADVFLLNWVKNQLMLFYGISDAIFSEQITVDLPGEPAALSQAYVQGGRRITVAVSLPTERRIAIIDGSITGDLSVRHQIPCPGSPDRVALLDLNGDRKLDLVAGTSRGIMVRVGVADGDFGPASVFSFTSGHTPWALMDFDGDGLTDLAVADATHRRLVVALNAVRGTAALSPCYAAGVAPSALTTVDLDGDGRDDIVMGSSQLSTLSVLFNRGDGTFSGLSGVAAPVHAQQIVIAGSDTNGTTLVLADAAGDRVGVITLARDAQVVGAYSMPAGREPFIMAAREHGEDRRVNVVVRSRDPRQRSVSLSLYEQIPGRQFLERHLHPLMPGRIIAATLASGWTSGTYDLVFVSHDPRTARAQVSRAISSPGFTFSTISRLMQYRDSLSSTRLVEVLPSNSAETMRVFVYRDFPSYTMTIASTDSTIPGPRWMGGVRPLNPDGVLLRDVNGDGRADVVFLADAPRVLKVSYQAEDGSLEPPVTVCKADNVTVFTLGELRRHGEVDLLLARGGEGTVEVLYDPFTDR